MRLSRLPLYRQSSPKFQCKSFWEIHWIKLYKRTQWLTFVLQVRSLCYFQYDVSGWALCVTGESLIP